MVTLLLVITSINNNTIIVFEQIPIQAVRLIYNIYIYMFRTTVHCINY